MADNEKDEVQAYLEWLAEFQQKTSEVHFTVGYND